MERRQFLMNSAMSGALFALSGARAFADSADAQIDIFVDEPLAVISPNLYGQFTEHIGGVIYDGVWVGENSKIPNQYGIRTELIERLKRIHVPVIRWPGGCFADSYDWMDGLGPAAQRPKRTNFWEVDPDAARLHEKGKQVFEPNQFGTNEFVRFCQMAGAQPYLAVNLRSLPPISFDRWVEYCNSPAGSTTLADTRAAAGFPQPFDVRYWGVGNESWGCGGNFTPEEYASEFRRYTSWLPGYGVDLQLIGSGPNGDDLDWTHRVFEQLFSDHPYDNPQFAGWSVHYYASNLSRGRTSDWIKSKGDALAFEAIDWYELMRQCNRIEQIIQDQWTAMGQYDTAHRIKLVIDEYGPWYREGTEVDSTHIFGQQVTLRDALATALTLDIFNRNAEKVSMAANAQLVNNLNALFLAHEDHIIATANYFVFEMYAAHQGGQNLRALFSAPEVHYVRDGEPARFWALNGSASKKDKAVTLTVVNPDLTRAMNTQITLHGAKIAQARSTVLTNSDMHAHNTFDHPDTIKPAPLQVSISAGAAMLNIPPASVTKLEIAIS
ncbi:MAG: alpha-L-arabinofuranosidase C-terminal domain-containing protein [Candidatus Sulfotelmatobacter sp.]